MVSIEACVESVRLSVKLGGKWLNKYLSYSAVHFRCVCGSRIYSAFWAGPHKAMMVMWRFCFQPSPAGTLSRRATRSVLAQQGATQPSSLFSIFHSSCSSRLSWDNTFLLLFFFLGSRTTAHSPPDFEPIPRRELSPSSHRSSTLPNPPNLDPSKPSISTSASLRF